MKNRKIARWFNIFAVASAGLLALAAGYFGTGWVYTYGIPAVAEQVAAYQMADPNALEVFVTNNPNAPMPDYYLEGSSQIIHTSIPLDAAVKYVPQGIKFVSFDCGNKGLSSYVPQIENLEESAVEICGQNYTGFYILAYRFTEYPKSFGK